MMFLVFKAELMIVPVSKGFIEAMFITSMLLLCFSLRILAASTAALTIMPQAIIVKSSPSLMILALPI